MKNFQGICILYNCISDNINRGGLYGVSKKMFATIVSLIVDIIEVVY